MPAERKAADPDSESYYDVGLFDYKSVRYTNWNKIPVIMPALKRLLQAVLGNKRVERISVRSYVYDNNWVHTFAGLIMFLFLAGMAVLRIFLLRRASRG